MKRLCPLLWLHFAERLEQQLLLLDLDLIFVIIDWLFALLFSKMVLVLCHDSARVFALKVESEKWDEKWEWAKVEPRLTWRHYDAQQIIQKFNHRELKTWVQWWWSRWVLACIPRLGRRFGGQWSRRRSGGLGTSRICWLLLLLLLLLVVVVVVVVPPWGVHIPGSCYCCCLRCPRGWELGDLQDWEGGKVMSEGLDGVVIVRFTVRCLLWLW